MYSLKNQKGLSHASETFNTTKKKESPLELVTQIYGQILQSVKRNLATLIFFFLLVLYLLL